MVLHRTLRWLYRPNAGAHEKIKVGSRQGDRVPAASVSGVGVEAAPSRCQCNPDFRARPSLRAAVHSSWQTHAPLSTPVLYCCQACLVCIQIYFTRAPGAGPLSLSDLYRDAQTGQPPGLQPTFSCKCCTVMRESDLGVFGSEFGPRVARVLAANACCALAGCWHAAALLAPVFSRVLFRDYVLGRGGGLHAPGGPAPGRRAVRRHSGAQADSGARRSIAHWWF